MLSYSYRWCCLRFLVSTYHVFDAPLAIWQSWYEQFLFIDRVCVELICTVYHYMAHQKGIFGSKSFCNSWESLKKFSKYFFKYNSAKIDELNEKFGQKSFSISCIGVWKMVGKFKSYLYKFFVGCFFFFLAEIWANDYFFFSRSRE